MMSRNRCVWPSIKPGSNVAVPRSIVLASPDTCACTCCGEPTSLILSFSIRTAAGESMLPLRGSNSRPDFINVTGTDDSATRCAALNMQTANGNIRLIFRFIYKFNGEMQQEQHCSRRSIKFWKTDHAGADETFRCFSRIAGTNAGLRTPILG